ncbi:hypothetical protein OAN22_00155 [Alphaproteobacteria bacterium]|nr:hypothetical protein [Alphaproteobacteria bacterium]
MYWFFLAGFLFSFSGSLWVEAASSDSDDEKSLGSRLGKFSCDGLVNNRRERRALLSSVTKGHNKKSFTQAQKDDQQEFLEHYMVVKDKKRNLDACSKKLKRQALALKRAERKGAKKRKDDDSDGVQTLALIQSVCASSTESGDTQKTPPSWTDSQQEMEDAFAQDRKKPPRKAVILRKAVIRKSALLL